ncbi:KH domain-containing protein [Eremococcus coleocola]|uniref:RNA-binding protein KhpA n=1 Tax=Eremococcus coleocola ACS-139-V-Col8 TaxID=908337 RepID=E4KNV0_9LACT|nr:KH domain-containing protein [Eremococcus coleocola]EFR31282.1 KH domain protein [Eremococcus coleocola ACS-139-V-Col8]
MPNIEDLITTMVTPLIEFPSDFSIEKEETEEFMEYHLVLNPEDIGRVIGRKGRVIRSIRTIVYSIRNKGEKRSRIVVDEEDSSVEELED